jgi:hypothetical protein
MVHAIECAVARASRGRGIFDHAKISLEKNCSDAASQFLRPAQHIATSHSRAKRKIYPLTHFSSTGVGG